MHFASTSSMWDDLPAEMKYTVVEHLDDQDIPKFSKLNRETYGMAVPSLYKEVNLRGSKALRSFLDAVPSGYCRHVRTLAVDLSMDALFSPLRATTALGDLLGRCSRVEQLSLSIPGSLKPSIIPYFERLHALRRLFISNCGRDENTPLSERLVVSIAASVPHLEHLELDRICRSAMHAPELVGAYPFIPVLVGDDDIPAHPVLGNGLYLPALLRLPTLRVLRIRDTHFGDERWATTPVCCQLDVLEIGSCCYESPDFNRSCAERIIDAVAHSVTDLYLSSPLSNDPKAVRDLRHLRSLHISPLLPLENLVDTLASLSTSPITTLSLACHEDDLAEEYVALEEFLNLCVEHKDGSFYSRLANISLRTVEDLFEPSPAASPKFQFQVNQTCPDAASAVQRLQERLQQSPNIQEELCSTDSCAFTVPSIAGFSLDELIAQEELEW